MEELACGGTRICFFYRESDPAQSHSSQRHRPVLEPDRPINSNRGLFISPHLNLVCQKSLESPDRSFMSGVRSWLRVKRLPDERNPNLQGCEAEKSFHGLTAREQTKAAPCPS